MLDAELLTQLKEVFNKIENPISMVVKTSSHADQENLLAMLNAVSSTNSNFQVKVVPESSAIPTFRIESTGIRFTGIPGGHEFSSLVIALLNVDGKGKLPDSMMAARIRNLKGPIRLQTYISLSCENCPDVVQALNQMALIHPDFKHEMIDGAYVQEEIKTLGIQGVPSVVQDGKLIHSGKITLLELLEKLEKHFGIADTAKQNQNVHLGHFDVAVVGGGPAGSSSAIYSARKGLKTAVIYDQIGGQVKETKGIENLISIPYTEGPTLAGQLSEHIAVYQIPVFEHRRIQSIQQDENKLNHLKLSTGETLTARSVILATGAKWRELNIPGEKQYLGKGVAFCPHCDGPFYKNKKIAVIGGGNSGVEAAIDLAGIVSEVTVFEYNSELKADSVLLNKLKSLPNAKIITRAKTVEVVGDGSRVTGLKYVNLENDQEIIHELDGIFVQIGLIPNSQFLKVDPNSNENGKSTVKVELNKMGEIIIDAKNRTSVKGIYAAGDVTTIPYKQIVISIGEGAKAALAAFEDHMLLT
jgi:alkyl hydroperoxide reductase subunit F